MQDQNLLCGYQSRKNKYIKFCFFSLYDIILDTQNGKKDSYSFRTSTKGCDGR